MVRVIEHYTSGTETVGGLEGNNGDAELSCHVLDCNSGLLARAAVLYVSPLTFHGLVRGPLVITPCGGDIYHVKIRYAKVQNKISVTLDTQCERIKKLRSVATIENVKVRYTGNILTAAPDFKRLIGVNKDKVEGVDAYEGGTFKFSLQWSTKFSHLSARGDYIYNILTNGATVNESDVIFNWKGQLFRFAKGTLLFVGGQFHDAADDGCDISLKFEGRLNDAEIVIGDLNGETVLSTTGSISSGEATITGIASTALLRAGMKVTSLVPGVGIPDDAIILTVGSSTSITMDQDATATASVDLTFSNPFFPEKEGWWYIWIRTQKVKVDGRDQEVADTAHMEQIYGYWDFSLLEVFDTINDQDVELAADLNNEMLDEQNDNGAAKFNDLPDDFGGVGGPI